MERSQLFRVRCQSESPDMVYFKSLNRYGLRRKTVLMTLARLERDEHCKGVDEILELMPILIKKCRILSVLLQATEQIAGD